MTNDVAQDDITYRQEVLSYREDDMKNVWIDYHQLKKEAEIVHEMAKKEANDNMSKLLADTTEKETLEKLEKICDSLIMKVGALINTIYGNSQQESRDSISTN